MSEAVGPGDEESPAQIVRRARGKLSQDAFADRLGTSRQRVIDWEKGRSGLSDEYAAKIAAIAGVPVEALLRKPPEDPGVAALNQIAGDLTELGGFVRRLEPDGRRLARAEEVAALTARLEGLEETLGRFGKATVETLERLEAAIARLSDQQEPPAEGAKEA